jgi:hypothetical protein
MIGSEPEPSAWSPVSVVGHGRQIREHLQRGSAAHISVRPHKPAGPNTRSSSDIRLFAPDLGSFALAIVGSGREQGLGV